MELDEKSNAETADYSEKCEKLGITRKDRKRNVWRHEQAEDGMDVPTGPHMRFIYKNKDLFKDAANLIIHHVKRQTGIHKEDKQKIKQLIRQFLPDLFCVPRGELSDDEVDKDEDMDLDDFNEDSKSPMPGSGPPPRNKKDTEQKEQVPPVDTPIYALARSFSEEEKDSHEKLLSTCNTTTIMENSIPDDSYALFFVNNNWYIFFRLHHILCERLHKIQERSQYLTVEEMKDREERLQSTAIALRLKSKTNVDVETYYAVFLEMVKNLLDGNVESNQYEDSLREMFGIEAYVGFTVDKIIQNIVRQLQHIVGEDLCTQCTSLFLEEQKFNAAGGSCSTASQRSVSEGMYQKKAETSLSEENYYKIILYKMEAKFTIEMLDTETDPSEGHTTSPRWSSFVENMLLGDEVSPNCAKEQPYKKPVYLQRNARWRRNDTRNGPLNKSDVDSDSCKIDLSGLEDSAAGDAVKGLVGLNPGKSMCQSEYKAMDEGPCLLSSCKLNLSQFNCLFVANTDATNGDVLLYKRLAIEKARQYRLLLKNFPCELPEITLRATCSSQSTVWRPLLQFDGVAELQTMRLLDLNRSHSIVSDKMNGKFHCWHNTWLKDNVTDEESKKCQNWLVGLTEDNIPTKCIKVDNPTKPPYAVYNRYRIQDMT